MHYGRGTQREHALPVPRIRWHRTAGVGPGRRTHSFARPRPRRPSATAQAAMASAMAPSSHRTPSSVLWPTVRLGRRSGRYTAGSGCPPRRWRPIRGGHPGAAWPARGQVPRRLSAWHRRASGRLPHQPKTLDWRLGERHSPGVHDGPQGRARGQPGRGPPGIKPKLPRLTARTGLTDS